MTIQNAYLLGFFSIRSLEMRDVFIETDGENWFTSTNLYMQEKILTHTLNPTLKIKKKLGFLYFFLFFAFYLSFLHRSNAPNTKLGKTN